MSIFVGGKGITPRNKELQWFPDFKNKSESAHGARFQVEWVSTDGSVLLLLLRHTATGYRTEVRTEQGSPPI